MCKNKQEKYYDVKEIGCELEGKYPTWKPILDDHPELYTEKDRGHIRACNFMVRRMSDFGVGKFSKADRNLFMEIVLNYLSDSDYKKVFDSCWQGTVRRTRVKFEQQVKAIDPEYKPLLKTLSSELQKRREFLKSEIKIMKERYIPWTVDRVSKLDRLNYVTDCENEIKQIDNKLEPKNK